MRKDSLKNAFDKYPKIFELVVDCCESEKFLQEYEIATLPPKLKSIVDFLREQPEGMIGVDIHRAMGKTATGRLVSIQLRQIMQRTSIVLVCDKRSDRGGVYSFNHNPSKSLW